MKSWLGPPTPARFTRCNPYSPRIKPRLKMSSTALVVAPHYNLPAPPGLSREDIKRAADFARQDKAASTREAYSSDFRMFEKFCRSRGVDALPATPETVAAFLA